KMRFAMLAAAALVKVRHRIFAGSVPSKSRRMTRCASTWVLPEPALADTQADTAGSDAVCCSAVTASRMRLFIAGLLGVIGAARQRPLAHAGEVIVITRIAAHEHRPLARTIRHVGVVEPGDDARETAQRLVGFGVRRGVLPIDRLAFAGR